MKTKLILFVLIVFSFSLKAATFTSISAGGNWNLSATWTFTGTDPDGIPDSDDDVVIDGPVALNTSVTCNSLIVNASKTFTINSSRTLTVTTTVINNGTIDEQGTLTITTNLTNNLGAAITNASTKTLSVSGNTINSGTITINGTYTASGTTTNDGTITINGTYTATGDFTNSGTINVITGGTLDTKLALTNNGTMTVSGTLKFSGTTDRTIGGSGTATINSLTTANNSVKTLSSGTWNISTVTVGGGNSEKLVFSGTGIYTVTTINHASTLGTITIGSTGTFNLTNVSVSGGGTIAVSVTNYTITTTETWTATSGTISFINVTNNSANVSTAASGIVTISGTLTNASTITNSGSLTVSGLLTNNAPGAITNTGTLTLDENTTSANLNAGTISGSGTVSIKRNLTNDGSFGCNTLNLTGGNAQTLAGTGSASISSLVTSGNGNKTFSAGTWSIVNSSISGGTGNLTFSGSTISFTGILLNNGTSNTVTFSNGITSLSINNVTINTSSGGTIIFNKDAVIGGTLTLTSGNVTLGSSRELTAYTISGGSSSSYIENNNTSSGSRLVRSVGTTPVFFPIGITGVYAPAWVNYSSGTSDTYIRVSNIFSTAPTDPTKAVGLEWNVNKVSGTGAFPGTLTLQWNSSDQGAGFSLGSAKVYHYVSPSWTQQTSTAAGGSDPYTITGSGITSFSPFGVFSSGALPVELASFQGSLQAGHALLEWKTLSERNNLGFELEKSLDAVQFTKIGYVEGSGNSQTPRDYRYVDTELTEVSYYRLKQLDFDGGSTLSKTVVVIPDGVKNEVVVYPNPSTEVIQISTKSPIQQLNLLNVTGELIWTKSAQWSTIDVQQLPKGIYLLQVVTEDGIRTKKIVKQ
ncbi:MAG: T9SS type A sorting domain-containing protein [Spirosomataceae bacterium]